MCSRRTIRGIRKTQGKGVVHFCKIICDIRFPAEHGNSANVNSFLKCRVTTEIKSCNLSFENLLSLLLFF